MADPRIDIVIPTRDRPVHLVNAVASALSECPQGGGVIVVDDGSTHPLGNLSHLNGKGRLTILRQNVPSGASSARNLGTAASSADLIFFLDDDDTFVPGYIESVINALRDHPAADYGFAAPKASTVRAECFTLIAPPRPLRQFIGAAGRGFWIRRRVLEGIGGFNSMQTIDEDTELCVRLGSSGHCALRKNSPGTIVRAHGDQEQRGGRLTDLTHTPVGVACYLRTYTAGRSRSGRIGDHWFLARRYIRRLIRLRELKAAFGFALSQVPLRLAISLYIYCALKILVMKLRSA